MNLSQARNLPRFAIQLSVGVHRTQNTEALRLRSTTDDYDLRCRFPIIREAQKRTETENYLIVYYTLYAYVIIFKKIQS